MAKKKKHALDYALLLLGRQDYPEKELRKKLTEWYEPDEVHETIEKLKEYGYVDDSRFLRHFIADRLRRGYGPFWIRGKLREKELECEPDDIERVAAEAEINILSHCRQQYTKYIERTREDDPYKLKQKAYAYLARRGYDMSMVKKVLHEGGCTDESDFS